MASNDLKKTVRDNQNCNETQIIDGIFSRRGRMNKNEKMKTFEQDKRES